MPDDLADLDDAFRLALYQERNPPVRVCLDGKCSTCGRKVSGQGRDEAEAFAAAEVEHFLSALYCPGHPFAYTLTESVLTRSGRWIRRPPPPAPMPRFRAPPPLPRPDLTLFELTSK